MAPAFAGTFNNNFNTDPSAAIQLIDPAKWVATGGFDGGYVSITDNVNDQQAAFIVPDLDAGTPVGGFLATFKLRIGDGTGTPADGFSFNFASDVPDSAFGEEGAGTGLTISFDTYDNGGAEAPAIDLKVGGNTIQTRKFAIADVGTGGNWEDVRVELKNGLLSLDYKGQSIYKDVALGMPAVSGGRFGFGARTGGANETHWVDNLSIQTFPVTAPVISAVRPNAKGFVLQLTDAPNSALDVATIAATVNGAAVTGTATKAGGITTFVYDGPALLPVGSTQAVVLTYKTGSPAVNATNAFNVIIPSYTVVPATVALPASAVDKTKHGFIWRIQQVDSSSTLANSLVRAEQQLAGALGPNTADPTATGDADGPAAAASPASAPIEFKVSKVINFSHTAGENNGKFTPDLQMPGMPGTVGTDNYAAEILTALEFPAAGTYTMIVNSDDGFRTTVGVNPRDVGSAVLGFFDAGRGAADTVFRFYIEAAGTYAFRTIFEQGNGGGNIEWSTELTDGTRVLINDTTTNPNAIKAYQLSPNALPGYVKSVSPAAGATMINRPKTVEAVLEDAGTTITANSVTLKLNGTTVPVTATKTGNQTKVVNTVVGDLQPSTPYTAELTYTDNSGTHTATWKFTTGPLSSTIFVIEAEDFDYSTDGNITGGKTNPMKGTAGLDVDVMPYYGGAYDTLGAVEGVDYFNNDAGDGAIYREETDAGGENEISMSTRDNIAAGNGKGGMLPINSSDRGSYTTTKNYAIGWVDGADWQNYTRTFPDNGQGGWWKVYAGLSYGGDADGQLAGSLDIVTSGVGTDTQTTDRVGQFSAPGSGGWGNNNLVPMKTASGGDAVVKLIGKQTVRFNCSSGDFDFLIFSAAPPPPPSVATAPQDSVKRDAVILDWTIKDADAKVNASTVKVMLDGTDYTAKSTSSKTNDTTYVHVDLTGTTFAAGERSYSLTFSDNSSPVQTTTSTGTFVVVPYPATSVFTIEAEDFNYSSDDVAGGKTNPQKGTAGMDVDVMPYDGGAYDTLSAIEGVDYVNNDANDSDFYRTEKDEGGENEVNIAASNGNRYSNDRGAFDLTNNYRIGWVEDGSWQNYTRTFPKADYNVWAALSFDGRAAGQLRGSLDLVTSDVTKPSQTTQRLGTFTAPGSGGWGRNELVPMKDTAGNMAVIPLEGTKTVRFNLGSGDFDYLVFVPSSATPQIKISSIKKNSNGSITLEWTGGGTLQTSTSLVGGQWADVNGAASPYTFTPTQKVLFARVRQ